SNCHVSRGGHPQSCILLHHSLRFHLNATELAFEPASEPTVHLQSRVVRQPVRKRSPAPSDLILLAEHAVNPPQLLKFLPTAGKVAWRIGAEEVLVTHAHQQRLRRQRIQEVPAIEAGGPRAYKILL